MSALPNTVNINSSNTTTTKGSNPITDRPVSTKTTATPPPPSQTVTPNKESPKTNGASPVTAADKAERDKQKRKEKKERKDREKADRLERDKAGGDVNDGRTSTSTPDVSSPTQPQLPSSSTAPDLAKSGGDGEDLRSPVTDGAGSTGARTPRGSKPPRHPWTIFMRMTVTVNETELREFFKEAKDGVSAVVGPTFTLNTDPPL